MLFTQHTSEAEQTAPTWVLITAMDLTQRHVSCCIRLDGLATTSNCKRESVQQTTARIRVDVGRRQLEHRCPLWMRMQMIVLSLPLPAHTVLYGSRPNVQSREVQCGSRSSRSCGLRAAGGAPSPSSLLCSPLLCSALYRPRPTHPVPPRPALPRSSKGRRETSLRQAEARRQHQPTSWPFRLPPLFPRQSSKLPRPFQLIDELDRPPSPSPSPSPFWPSTDPPPIHPPILIFCPSLNLRPPSHPASVHHLDARRSRFALPIAISTALWRPETFSPISNLIESESYLLGISPATRSATVLQL
jgi:hypothetical protein